MTSLLDDIASVLIGCTDTPRADVRVFLNFYKGNPTAFQIENFVLRRQKREPVSKILGKRGFWTLDLNVTADVLDPRPDSEILIESVLKHYLDGNPAYRILDIGTGSGCLLLALLSEYPNAVGMGVDKSPAALAVARQNGQGANAEFVEADFTDSNFLCDVPPFDMIVSNPPYIPTATIDTLETEVRAYDPLMALDGGVDGLDAYRALGRQLKRLLKPGGKVFLEIGKGQEMDVISIMEENGFNFIEWFSDYGKIIRILCFK